MIQLKALRAALIGTTALTALAATPASAQTSFQGFTNTSFLTQTAFYGISPDGVAVVGIGECSCISPPTFGAAFWQTSNLQGSALVTAGEGALLAASDGGGAVGWENVGGPIIAVYSPPGTGFAGTNVTLPGLTGSTDDVAYAINANSTVAVGSSNGNAVRWNLSADTITPLLSIGGASPASGVAYGVSDSGNIIIGQVNDTGQGKQAVEWINGGLAHVLPPTSTNNSGSALAVSGDGSTAVGYSGVQTTPTGSIASQTATRWTLSTNGTATALGLGTLSGGQLSEAVAVNHDGSVVVGWSGSATPDPTNASTLAGASAFRWTSTDNIQSVQGLLATAGVNMGSWHLTDATGVSSDGRTIVGYGTNGNNQVIGWLARIALPQTTGGGGTTGGSGTTDGGGTTTPPLPTGFISFDTLAASFAGQAAIGQMGNSIIGGDLAAFNQYATQDHGSHGDMPWSVFGYASYNSDPAGSGTVGITRDLPWSMIVGAAVSADFATTSMVFNGKATMQGGSGGIFAARVPDSGLQWFLGVDGAALSGSATRGYLNGSGPASSFGDTNINGYGATARIGWTFNNIFAKTQITPFASYTYTLAHVNGYIESSGPFPAVMDAFDSFSKSHASALTRDTRSCPADGYGERQLGLISSMAVTARRYQASSSACLA
jgi:hypothetical protein